MSPNPCVINLDGKDVKLDATSLIHVILHIIVVTSYYVNVHIAPMIPCSSKEVDAVGTISFVVGCFI